MLDVVIKGKKNNPESGTVSAPPEGLKDCNFKQIDQEKDLLRRCISGGGLKKEKSTAFTGGGAFREDETISAEKP